MSEAEIPFKLPSLSTYGEDMSKRWEVSFWVWNQNLNEGKGALQRKQERIPLRFTKKERYERAEAVIVAISRSLHQGKHIRLKEKKLAYDAITKLDFSVIEAYSKIIEVKKGTLKHKSFLDYKNEVERFCAYLSAHGLDELLLKEFTTELCIDYLDWYQAEREVTNRTRNNTLSFMRSMTNDLIARGYLGKNPWNGIKKEKTIVGQNFPFTAYHKSLLIPELQKDPQLWQACQFIYYLFRRTGEIEAMKIGQINWQLKHVMIPNTFKSGEAKYPVISKSFEPILADMGIMDLDPDWYVFGRGGKPGPYPLKSGNLTARFTKIKNRLGLGKKYSFYCWKHTGNLDAVLSGVNIKAIQQQNGHAKIEDTDKYLRSLGVEHNQQIRDQQPSLGGF